MQPQARGSSLANDGQHVPRSQTSGDPKIKRCALRRRKFAAKDFVGIEKVANQVKAATEVFTQGPRNVPRCARRNAREAQSIERVALA